VPFLKLNRMKGPVAGDVRTSNAIDPEKSTRKNKPVGTPIPHSVIVWMTGLALTNASEGIIHLGHTSNIEQRDERLV